MSQENVDRVRAAIDAFNRGDLNGLVADMSRDFEYIPSGRLPDADKAYRGPDEFKRFIGWLTDQFDDARLEVHQFIDAGDQVVASVSNRGRGKASGVETSWNVWLVWTLRDAKAIRAQAFIERADALKAAGLRE